MKKGLIRVDIRDMSTQEWVENRNNGIGGSDVGVLLGLSEYKCKLQLFHEKIGLTPVHQIDNEATYGGRILEEVVHRDYWRYADPTLENREDMLESLWENSKNGHVVRKARNVNAVLINPDYPWLHANIDKHIPSNEFHPEGILEIKTALGFAMNKWEGGLPPMYVVQLMTYMEVCDVDYGEFALLRDGRFFDMFPVPGRSKPLIDQIVNETGEFWRLVEQGKEIVMSGIGMEDMRLALQEIEPEPEDTKAYENYLKERYKEYKDENAEVKVKANDEVLVAIDKYWSAHGEIKNWEAEKRGAGNVVRNFLDVNRATEIELPSGDLVKNYGKLVIPKI